MKKLKAFFRKLSLGFSSYEENIINGLDIENIQNAENKESIIERYTIENKEKSEAKQREYENILNEFVLFQKIHELPGLRLKKIENLARKYSETMALKTQIELEETMKEDKFLSIEAYEDSIEKAIEILTENEEMQRKVKKDLAILEAEKEELEMQHRSLRGTLEALKYFFIFLALGTLLTAIVLATLTIIVEREVTIAMIISIVIIFFLFLWAYIFRRYAHHELKKNVIMQKRAIELLNKTKLKYLRYQQVLDFQYTKYKVNSKEVLQLRYDNYKKTKAKRRKIEDLNRTLKEVILELGDTLEDIYIKDVEIVLQHAEYIASRLGRQTLLEQYDKKRDEIKEEIKSLETQKKLLESL